MANTYTVDEIAAFEEFMRDPGRRAAFATTKRRYDRVFRAVFALPWAILDSYMEVVATILVEHVSGDVPDAATIAERMEGAADRRPSPTSPGVAVIPVHGVIAPKASALAESSGAMSIERLRGDFRAAMNDRAVSAIVFDIDSPGGSVFDVPEFAGEIRAARGRKPITAAITGIGASAAYWLASQADEVVITPSGLTGSIGVVSAHEDVSAAAEQKGLRVTLISAGKHKTDGNPMEPLSADAREHTQAMVDEFYGMFTSDVARGRRVHVDDVRNGFGEGRVVNARMAAAMGMVDRIDTIESVIRGYLAPPERVAAITTGSNTSAAGSFDVIDPPVPGDMFVETDDVVPDDPADIPGTPGYDAVLGAIGVSVDGVAYDDAHFDAVDESAWDGNRAMGQCSTASDYRSICAGEHTTGEPDQRQHWALPHHYLGREANRAGVNNAASRLPQTRDLRNRAAAQAHIARHQSAMRGSGSSSDDGATSIEAMEHQLALMRLSRSPATPGE